MEYTKFLKSKDFIVENWGFKIDEKKLNKYLYPFQKSIVKWALMKGRCAVYADCGLGKSIIQLDWLNKILDKFSGETGLIVAPLSVAHQTIQEGVKFGIDVNYAEDKSQIIEGQINITNYERLDSFNSTVFIAVVLDESSILKSVGGKIKNKCFEMFCRTKFRMACTATPAPNDVSELANQIQFLGVMSREEMLSKFFVNDNDGWRLKGHAINDFYKWMAKWSVFLRKPSDIGFSNKGFDLPELKIDPIWAEVEYKRNGHLFETSDLKGIQDRLEVRKHTIKEKAKLISKFVKDKNEQYLIWAGLNDEADELEKLIDDSIQLKGADMKADKIQKIDDFKFGKIRVLITKPKIAGFGMNFQNCHNMIFIGLSDSYEYYYQCIRRCWRHGQDKSVQTFIVLSHYESMILDNVKRKEKQANDLHDGIVVHVSEFNRQELGMKTKKQKDKYKMEYFEGKDWQLWQGDSAETINDIEENSIDMSVFSPPFSSLYTYSPSERDLGNCKSDFEFFEHFGYITHGLRRIMKPGRITCCHVSQIPAMLVRDGYIGLKDFRGDVIRHFIKHGFIFQGEVVIDKNPQAQSIRTHAKGLTFTQLEKDSSWMRPALGDYILLFRKPGENGTPINNGDILSGEVSRDEWIELAHPIWYNIRETDTLNFREARKDEDEKHIAPLQLETIRRCLLLWSNPGELIYSPFAGIGSEGYMSLLNNRKFTGCELKPEYAKIAAKNLKLANEKKNEKLLFNAV